MIKFFPDLYIEENEYLTHIITVVKLLDYKCEYKQFNDYNIYFFVQQNRNIYIHIYKKSVTAIRLYVPSTGFSCKRVFLERELINLKNRMPELTIGEWVNALIRVAYIYNNLQLKEERLNKKNRAYIGSIFFE